MTRACRAAGPPPIISQRCRPAGADLLIQLGLQRLDFEHELVNAGAGGLGHRPARGLLQGQQLLDVPAVLDFAQAQLIVIGLQRQEALPLLEQEAVCVAQRLGVSGGSSNRQRGPGCQRGASA